MRTTMIVATMTGLAMLGTAACGTATPTAAPATTAPAAGAQPAAVPTTAASTAHTAPPVGTVLHQFDGSGSVISGGSGFSYLETPSSGTSTPDQSSITTYTVDGTELARIGGGAFTGTCGAADVVTNGQRRIITELLTTQPAQGIRPAQYSADLDAWDATTGTHLWKSTVVSPQAEQLSCDSSGGPLKSVNVTDNGGFALYSETTGNLAVRAILDLSTGKVRTDGRSVGVFGDYLIDVDPTGNSSTAEVIDPATGKVVGSFSTDASSGLSIPHTMPLALGRIYSTDTGTGSEQIRLSGDGKTLFAHQASNDNGASGFAIEAHRLPDLTTLWKTPAPSSEYQVMGADGGLVIIQEHPANQPASLVARSDKTGQEAWRLPAGQVCGTTSSQLLVLVNQQLATIDLASGQQVSYSQESSCPSLLAGGISVSGTNNETTVTQTLKP